MPVRNNLKTESQTENKIASISFHSLFNKPSII